jgi:hypothetical protein
MSESFWSENSTITAERLAEATVNPKYDLFETLPNGERMWLVSVEGLENARQRLATFAQQTKNECFAISVATGETVGRINGSHSVRRTE